jgi:hypothetical protein
MYKSDLEDYKLEKYFSEEVDMYKYIESNYDKLIPSSKQPIICNKINLGIILNQKIDKIKLMNEYREADYDKLLNILDKHKRCMDGLIEYTVYSSVNEFDVIYEIGKINNLKNQNISIDRNILKINDKEFTINIGSVILSNLIVSKKYGKECGICEIIIYTGKHKSHMIYNTIRKIELYMTKKGIIKDYEDSNKYFVFEPILYKNIMKNSELLGPYIICAIHSSVKYDEIETLGKYINARLGFKIIKYDNNKYTIKPLIMII